MHDSVQDLLLAPTDNAMKELTAMLKERVHQGQVETVLEIGREGTHGPARRTSPMSGWSLSAGTRWTSLRGTYRRTANGVSMELTAEEYALTVSNVKKAAANLGAHVTPLRERVLDGTAPGRQSERS